MKRLSYSFIEKLLNNLKRRISSCMGDKKFNLAIRYLQAYSFLQYKFYLGFVNENTEKDIKKLALEVRKDHLQDFINDETVVFVDNICADPIGLTQQYIDALIQGGYYIVYIYRNEFPSQKCTTILDTLGSYSRAIVFNYPKGLRGIELSQWLYDTIINTGARRVIMHLVEWAIEENIVSCCLQSKIKTYRICLSDHTFWTGSKCTDYIFEFRQYGCNLSWNLRGVNKDQILYMPFYPAIKEKPFDGFPEEVEGKFVFLTGGSLYKIVDKENTFFRLCKSVLDYCPNAVVLFVGGTASDSVLERAIEEFQLYGRFFPIGYRHDIYEVFKNCDVFINTYPIGGGLMCQYAALCSKPILNYKISSVEDCVNQRSQCHFTYMNEDDFVKEACLLYNNSDYLSQRGDSIKSAIINKRDFDEALAFSLSQNKSYFKIEWDRNFKPRDYNREDAVVFINSKDNLVVFYCKLYRILGFSLLLLCPRVYIELNLYRVMRKIKASLRT